MSSSSGTCMLGSPIVGKVTVCLPKRSVSVLEIKKE